MGNRVLSIQSNQVVVDENEEIYTDVSLVSGQSESARHMASDSSKPRLDDYYRLLATENPETKLVLSELKRSSVTAEEAIQKIAIVIRGGYAEAMRRYREAYESGGKYRVSRSINVRAVQNSLDNIFTFIPGERILDPEFGSKLKYYLYEGITPQNEERIVSEIRSCVIKYDPRVQITNIRNISTVQDTEENTVKLDIVYTIRGLPDKVFSKQFIFNKSQE